MARTVGFEGLDERVTTFLSSLDSTSEGKPVKITSSKTVDVAGDSEVFIGKAIKVESDGAVSVQYGGYVEFVYSGTDPTIGYVKLAADINGGVKVDVTNGKEYLVLKVDTTNKIIGFML